MPKLKNYKPGKRVNIWLPSKYFKLVSQLDNFSKFVQISLDQAEGVIAFDIIKKRKGYQNKPPTQEALDEFNALHPLDPLTQKRTGKCRNTQNSRKNHVLW
jgi:hypothetical protein